MSIEEENKALVIRYFEEANKGNMTVIDELCASEYVYHGTTGDLTREQFKHYVNGMLAAFPDLIGNVDDMVAEGDRVAVRFSLQATHQGVFKDIAPTGKRIMIKGLEIDIFAGGKFVETWIISDTLGMLQQLGVIPSQ
jgi:predicted ester cyclase